jgi:hypothetical protein
MTNVYLVSDEDVKITFRVHNGDVLRSNGLLNLISGRSLRGSYGERVPSRNPDRFFVTVWRGIGSEFKLNLEYPHSAVVINFLSS